MFYGTGEQFDSSLEAESEERSNLEEFTAGLVLSLLGYIIWVFLLDCDSERLSIPVVLLSSCPLVRDNNPLVSILFLCTFDLEDIDYLVG